jgi:O-antigen polysaccharide polymerase Wzy
MSAAAVRIALSHSADRRTDGTQETWTWVSPLLASVAATVVLLAKAQRSWTHVQAALAFSLVAMPCFAYAEWLRTRRTQIPLFAVLAAGHTVFYCWSLFWTDILAQSQTQTATAVLGMANLGVLGLFAGMKIGVSGMVVRRVYLPDVPDDVRRWWLIRGVAACQILVPFLPVGTGGDFRQIVAIVLSFIPLVAFLILWDSVLRGKGAPVDKTLVVVFLASSILAGLATGWLYGCVGTLVLASIAFVRVRRRLPAIPIVAIALTMGFLQGGKSAFRERFWYGTDDAGPVEKARYWVEKSIERVTVFSSQPGTDPSAESLESPLLSRSSLVRESATVYENTPSLVPFQYGASYQYLLITLIPRFLWPAKPSVNDSNRFYQVAYGVTQADDLDHVAIGAGLIPEAYMNFGWAGIPVVMCLAGILLGVFERVFLGRKAGTFASAVGLAYVLQLLALNGQAAAYFGGMIQIVGFTILIFLPCLRFQPRKARLQWRRREVR